jgi:hypothetical protein
MTTKKEQALQAAIADLKSKLAGNTELLRMLETATAPLAERRVGKTVLKNGMIVSTVRSLADADPDYPEWESLVFTPRIDPFSGEEAIGTHHDEARYYSEDEAKAGHAAMIEKWGGSA